MTSLQPDPSSTSRYRASLLGPFTLERDGSVLDTSAWQRRVESLFKLLIIAPAHRRSRDEVLELLWPDAPPEAASANLRLLAHRLRLALCVHDPSPILLEHGWVRLNPAHAWDTDVAHFEDLVQRAGDDIGALEKAASLYRGEPLLEERYEEWAIPIRERIQRQWRVATLKLAQLHRSRGSLDQAAQWYERVLESDPLDEEALQGILAVLGKLGRRTEALRRYRQFEQRLAEELEVPPEPETRAMMVQLEAQAWQGIDHLEEAAPRPIPFLPSYPLPAAGSCVGRASELAFLLEALPARGAEGPRLVLVTAEAGMGKTQLLAEAAKLAREADMLVLAGGSYEHEGKLPYGPVHDALLDYVRAQPAQMLRRQLDGLLPELSRIVPELQVRMPEIEEPPGGDPETQRLRLFSTLAQVVERLSRDIPLVLLLDDLHWADDATLQLLHFLVRQIGPCRALIIGAYREEEVSADSALAQLAASGVQGERTERMRLGAFDEAAMSVLLEERLEGPCASSLVTNLYERSGGNPFFALQILGLLQQQGMLEQGKGGWQVPAQATRELPPEVRETVSRRLRQLRPETQRTLTLGAVLGREFGYPPLEHLWDGDKSRLFAALDAASGAHLLTETEEGYAFTHPLLHQVVYERIQSQMRTWLHSQAGLALEQLYGDRAAEHAAELTRHFVEARDLERGWRYALLAGTQAESAYAHEEAEQQYHCALEVARELGDESREAEALEKLGKALYNQSRFGEALEALEQAAQINRRHGDLLGEGRVVAQIAWAGLGGPRQPSPAGVVSGIMRVQAALERSKELEPSLSRFALYDVLATMLSYRGKHGQALEAVQEAVDLARAMSDTSLLARALAGRGMILDRLGRQGEALETLEAVIPLAEQARDLESLGRALSHAAQVYRRTGLTDRARRYSERFYEVAKQLASPAMISESTNMAGWAAYLHGDWDRARSLWAEGATILQQMEGAVLALPAGLRWQQGEGSDARRELEDCAAAAERTGDMLLLAEAHYWLAEADLVAGDMEAVVARLEPLLDRVIPGPGGQQKTILLQSLARAYLELGKEAEARDIVADVLSAARAEEKHHALVEALSLQGLVLTRQRRWEEAEHVFEESLTYARSLPYPFGEAQTLHACGRMHADRGEPERARENLEEALAVFQRLGARPYAWRTEQALARLPNDHAQSPP